MTRLALGLGLSSLIGGCAMKHEGASVNVSFPNWSQLRANEIARRSKVSSLSAPAFSELKMVVVNVTGPNMQPIYKMWEKPDRATSWSPPQNVVLNIPNGQNRLVQVLGVYEGTGSMEFYYGDSLRSLTGAEVQLPITLMNVAASSNLTEGQITGRWLDAGGASYTGVVQYRVTPVTGKPSMVVHWTEAFGGWIRLFSLSSPILSYSKPDGTPLFQGLFNSNPALHDTASYPLRTMSVHVPQGLQQRGGMGSPTYESRLARRHVVGFFGPGAENLAVCYQQTLGDPNTSTLKDYYWQLPANSGNQVLWNGTASAPSAYEAFIEPIAGVFGGQGVGNVATCAATLSGHFGHMPVEWAEFVTLDHMRLGEESALAFSGPFAKVASDAYSNRPVFVTLAHDADLDQVTASWDYLPGAGINSASVFYRIQPNGMNYDDQDIRLSGDGYRCNEFVGGGLGMMQMTVGGGAETATLPGINSTDFGNLQIVVCPFNDAAGKFFASAVSASGRASMGALGLKLTGSTISGLAMSDFFSKAMLNAPIQILKTELTGADAGYLTFMPAIGGSPIPSADIVSLETSVDKIAWNSVGYGQSQIGGSGPNYPFASGTNIATSLSTLLTGASDPIFYVRYKISSSLQQQYQLTTDTFVSKGITAVDTTCAAPGVLQLVDSSNNTFLAATMFSDIFGQPNGTDLSKSYHVRYSGAGCGAISVPIDRISFDTQACFSQADLMRDPVDPFKILVSPTDSTGANCTPAGLTISIVKPSNAGTVNIQRSVSGLTVNHSVVPSQVGLVLNASGTMPTDLTVSHGWIRYLMSGPASQWEIVAAQLNSDAKVPNAAAGPGSFFNVGSADWGTGSTNPAAPFFTSLPISTNLAPLTVVGSPPATLASAQHTNFAVTVASSPAALTGSFPMIATAETDKVIGVSSLWGGPVVITRDGSNNVKLYYAFTNTMTNQMAPSYIDITPPGGINTASRVTFTQLQSMGGNYTKFVVTYGNWVRYGAMTSNGGYVAKYSNAYQKVGMTVFQRVHDLGNGFMLVFAQGSQFGYYFKASTNFYDANTDVFTDPQGASPGNEYFGAFGAPDFGAGGISIDATRCDPQDPTSYIVGRNSGGLMMVQRVDGTGTIVGGLISVTGTTLGASHDRVVCSTLNPNNGDGVRVFMALNSASVSTAPILGAINSNSGTCGAGALAVLSVNKTLPTASGRWFGSSAQSGFIVNTGATSGMDTLSYLQMTSCSASSVSWAANQQMTQIPGAVGKQFVDMWRDPMAQKPVFHLFGENMQYLQLEFY